MAVTEQHDCSVSVAASARGACRLGGRPFEMGCHRNDASKFTLMLCGTPWNAVECHEVEMASEFSLFISASLETHISF